MLMKHGKSFVANLGERVANVKCTDISLSVSLEDYRYIPAPLGFEIH